MSTDFVPPSEEIQRLFVLEKNRNQGGLESEKDPKLATLGNTMTELHTEGVKHGGMDEFSFTEEEFAKMPSTLMKAVRRTDALLLQTEAARKAAIETNNELKGIHSLLVRYAKKMLKDSEKNEAAIESNMDSGKTRGFRRHCRIIDVMCEFMGLECGSMSSRVDVNRFINDYIKKNGLIDKENAQRILPDEKLWSILSENAKGNTITYFSIQKYIKHHYK
jgi:hypothetical protein